MKDWRARDLHDGSNGPDRDAWQRYMHSCQDYLKRQILVYKNWPQRRFGPVGYGEPVFTDQNA
ncbi:MAG: hypothetical protein ACT4PT_00450 [Methanobacteriota archaeon]